MTLRAPFDRITIEPGKMGGQPCIHGMRITVRRVLDILATYATRAELFIAVHQTFAEGRISIRAVGSFTIAREATEA